MNHFFHGMLYLLQGFQHLFTDGLKRFIIVPMALNFILFTGLFYFTYHYVFSFTSYYLDKLPSWLSVLSGIFFIIFIISFFLLFLSMFTVVFNVIAAPFNGLLAEKTQIILYNSRPPSLPFYEMALRTMKRQGEFLKYYLLRFVGICLLFFVPFIQPVYPFLWFLFTAWMISVQYQDFAMDNNLVSFKDLKQNVKNNKMRSLGLGTSINLVSFIPFLNILAMPAAVIGSTILYCEHNKQVRRKSPRPN
ncbi:sulfate transporter CysZ [Legionella bononiensis]|uniref:Sulfate transporter CysZ n=1 Tax=Legionella bononiensis TaxID=2793102 RepID=A0ABS1W9U3_9GAMM|nr:sulfate transporter CysZ [Legionella bononiensis]MBL7480682.1 sulfate transporter CysZ [Legionella bononiensis]MBL7526119.1 sulfate transporter CysZ [Legionella bononiensis]MBL7563386.1 sulfate transporter CysZ [Legionella bononiensis]